MNAPAESDPQPFTGGGERVFMAVFNFFDSHPEARFVAVMLLWVLGTSLVLLLTILAIPKFIGE
jgi:hypothetical protein